MNRDVEVLETRRRELETSLQRELNEGQQELYDTYLHLARQAWQADDIELAYHHLNRCPERLRKTAWFDLKRQCFPPFRAFAGRNCVAISDDGHWLATAGEKNKVNVWDLRTGELRQLKLHGHAVSAVDFSRNGKWLATAAGDEVILWDIKNGWAPRMLSKHPAPITDLEFSPDGKRLASASSPDWTKGRVLLFDLETDETAILPDALFSVAFNHDGTLLATFRFSDTYELVVWDLLVDQGDIDASPLIIDRRRYRGPTALSDHPVFHPTRNELAEYNPEEPSRIDFWDVDSHRSIGHFEIDMNVHRLAYSYDGKRVVCAGTVRTKAGTSKFRTVTWNLVTREKEQILPWYASAVTCVLCSPNGKQLATADAQTVKLWNVTAPPDPTEAILDAIGEMNVGRHDWPGCGGTGARMNTPYGENMPIDWGGMDEAERQRRQQLPEWPHLTLVPETAKNIKWAVPLGSRTYGNPVVANGKTFVGTNNAAGYLRRYPSRVDLGVLLCFDEETGHFRWQHSNEKLPRRRVQDWELQGVCSTPTVDGDRLWDVSNRGEVVCLDTEGYHDGEDGGEIQREWGRIFDSMRSGDPTRDQVGPIVNPLNDGKVADQLLELTAERGVDLPEKVTVATDEPSREWSLTATIADAERQFRVQLVGPKLSAFKLITLDDKDEADVVWKFNMMNELGVSQHSMANCSIVSANNVLFVCTSNGVDASHENLPAPDAPSFIALDRDTGKVLWTDNSPGQNILHAQWASPCYGVFAGQPQVIFPGGDGWLYSFDPEGDSKGGSKTALEVRRQSENIQMDPRWQRNAE